MIAQMFEILLASRCFREILHVIWSLWSPLFVQAEDPAVEASNEDKPKKKKAKVEAAEVKEPEPEAEDPQSEEKKKKKKKKKDKKAE